MLTCDNCGSDDLIPGEVLWDEDAEEWYQEYECADCGCHTQYDY